MRAKPLVGTLTCLLLVTACSSPVQHQDGDAAPAGSPAQTTGAPVTTAPASSAPPSSGATTASLVLGPVGIGSLKLGMTKQQATATGMLPAFDRTPAPGNCAVSHLRDDPTGTATALLSPTLGIAAINAYGSVKTPEGVHVGTSRAEVIRIYPGWQASAGDSFRGYVKVPGNDNAEYRIAITNGTVTALTLQYKNQDCYE
ncbi:hypothetical protein [Dactylosporangium salmoneum]|uniref:Lipoprotein n=1 Tax=Dactylosporangium salmoneum TaxID=53361 RepID=A0ABN3HWM8_9ACTN